MQPHRSLKELLGLLQRALPSADWLLVMLPRLSLHRCCRAAV